MASLTLFKIETQPISEETKRIAVQELREVEDIVEEGFKELRELLAIDATMLYDTDDEFLRIFLRRCKYYAKSAYNLMKRIADYRAKYNYIYDNLLPEMLKDAFYTSDIYNILINRDQKGRRMLICRAKNWDPSTVTSDQMLQMQYLQHIVSLLEPETQVRGFVVIIDCQDIAMKQIKGFTPSFAYKLLTFIQYALPLRLKEFHVINNPFIFNIAWAVVKPLLRDKSRKRIFVHGKDITSLHKFIAPNYLPEDFGGSLPKIWYSGKDWYPALEGQIDFIKKWNDCGKITERITQDL